MRRTILIAMTAAIAVALAACTPDAVEDPAATGSPGTVGFPAATAAPAAAPGDDGSSPFPAQFVELTAASSCDALLEHYVDNAVDLVTPWGLGGGGGVVMLEGDMAVAESAESLDAPAAATATDEAGGDFSTTNVQEAGVDEPDTVKTDGVRLVTITEGRVDVVDVASAEVVGSVRLDEEFWDGQLLMAGDDLLVMSTTGSGWGGPMPTDLVPAFPVQRTTITRIDLTDPADPTVIGTATIEGSYRSARMVDGTVRLVIESQPTGLALTTPTDSGLSAEDAALEENQRLLRESDLDDWVPHYRVTGPDGIDGEVQPLLACDQVALPIEFSGFETLSVVTMAIDDAGMQPTSAAGIVASGETVYASTDRLIVATSPWGQWFIPFAAEDGRDGRDDVITTQLHSFDITDPAATTYVGSGEVEGTMVNQFALSEVDGVVRVATTTSPNWWGRGDEESQSSLVMLAEEGRQLVETGRVDGLGVTEQIHSVRYLSPELAAVVTFRQTDPLYLVDTSDPTAPTVAGELKIPGVSTYLHPIGDGWLLGVGQDATDDGRTTGLQLSLFDVSDPADPRRVDNLTWPGGYSPAEYDHHAFLHWATTGQVVLPLEIHDEFVEELPAGEPSDQDVDQDVAPREDKPFAGAVVVEVEPGRLVEQGMVTQDGSDGRSWDGTSGIQRSLVIGDDLWTLGWGSLARHDLATLDHEVELSLR